MSITVERRYRVTTDGAASDLSEDEARALAFGLLTALGIAPAAMEPAAIPAQWAPAEIVPPPQLPSAPPVITAPVPRDAPTRLRTDRGEPGWTDEDDTFLRDERAKGKTWVLLGELLGRTASECKARHDGLPPLRVQA